MGVGGMKKKIHPSRRSMMMKAIKGDSSSSLTWAMDDDDELSSSTFFVSSMTSMKRILLSNKKSTTTYTMKLSGQKDYERQTRRRRRRSRSISFNENVQVHKVQPVSSLLLKEEDIQQIWYTNDEMNEIKRKYMALVYVQRKEYTDDERRQMPNYCIRGLEPLIHKKQRQERISVAMQCVLLDGQHNGVDENNNNRLARAYKEATNQSIIDAVRRGTSDSVLASSIHRRNNTTRTKNM